jgi:fumarate hydratase subunit alpha
MEKEILQRINELDIGLRLGGRTTAFSVAVEAAPTHIAGLPVAVNMGCHVTRHASVNI